MIFTAKLSTFTYKLHITGIIICILLFIFLSCKIGKAKDSCTIESEKIYFYLQHNDFSCFSKILDSIQIGDIPLYKGVPLVHLAAKNNNRSFLLRTLESGADINRIDETSPSKPTPIFSAIMSRNFENVELLIGVGANINIVGIIGWTPIRYAAALNEYGLVLSLLTAGADWSVIDKHEKTLIEQIQTSRIDKQSPQYENLKKVIKFLHSKGVTVHEPRNKK